MEKISGLPLKIIRSLAAAYLVSGIMLLFLAFLMFRFSISDAALSFGIVLTYLLANIVGGFIMGRSVKMKKFAWGILIGAMYIFILYIVGNILGSGLHGYGVILPAIICLVGSMFGGIVS